MYRSFAYEIINGTKGHKIELPDYIIFNATNQNYIYWDIVQPNKTMNNTWFEIHTEVTVVDEVTHRMQYNTIDERSFWILNLMDFPVFPPNVPPILSKILEDKIVYYNETI